MYEHVCIHNIGIYVYIPILCIHICIQTFIYIQIFMYLQYDNDPCIYLLNSRGWNFIIAVDVDDVILTGKSYHYIKTYVKGIGEWLGDKDIGVLHWFL